MTETETGTQIETGGPETVDRDQPRVTLRPARPSEDHETQTAETQTNNQTETTHSGTETTAQVQTGTAATETQTEKTGRLRAWRDRRQTEARDRETREAETKAAALATAAARRTTHTETTTVETETDIAPVPRQLKWLGVWLDRTFGAVPLVSPLLVSGYYTMQVFTDQPIGAHALIALAATCALEGGVWKLARLYEKTLVAGDSTIGLRLGIAVYLAIISGLIYWHADHQAKAAGRGDIGWDWLPAAGVAAMSALGVFIWSRTARWQRRRELHAAGRIDRQAPKFAALAWVLTPLETPRALRHAVKFRIDSPVAALEDLRLYVAAGKPAIWPPIQQTGPETTAETTVPVFAPVQTEAPQTNTVPVPAPVSDHSGPETTTGETQTVHIPVPAPVQTEPAVSIPAPVYTVPVPVPNGTHRAVATETRPHIETIRIPAQRDHQTARPVSVPPTATRAGLSLVGKTSDEEYLRIVRDHYPDWADPNRPKPVTAEEIKTATGLRGKATVLRIRNRLYATPLIETPAVETTETEETRDLATTAV